MSYEIPVGLSNRHIHVSQKDLDMLFGKDYQLTRIKDLSQPGQFACDETVDIVGPKGVIKAVRILGPTRDNTQIEISISDSFILGVDAILRNSGDIKNTPGVKLIGPKGEVEVQEGVIVASRHIHMHTDDSKKMNLKNNDIVSVEAMGDRGVIFKNVLVRVSDTSKLELHLDMEEGNASGLKNGDTVKVV